MRLEKLIQNIDEKFKQLAMISCQVMSHYNFFIT